MEDGNPDQGDTMMNNRERMALLEAANRRDGWGLFNQKTTQKLAGRGFFVKEKHPVYGMQWRITEAGREALAADGAELKGGQKRWMS